MGSHVARELNKQGHDVVCLDDLSGGFARNLPVGLQDGLRVASILNTEFLGQLFAKEKFDAVYHLAAYAAEGLSHFIRKFNYENNVIGSINLINEAVKHNVARFVFTSSIAVYGSQRPPFFEWHRAAPEDPYGIAKAAVEEDLKAAREMFGLEYTIFRPHNVYGPQQHIGDKYRNVIGIYMNAILKGEPCPVFGDGTQTRAFSYIGDVVSPMVRCIDMPETAGMTFNVGGHSKYSILELIDTLKLVTGKAIEPKFLPARIEVAQAYSDHSLLDHTFGMHLTAPLNLKSGLARMWDWAQTLGPQEQLPFVGTVELTRNLPVSWR